MVAFPLLALVHIIHDEPDVINAFAMFLEEPLLRHVTIRRRLDKLDLHIPYVRLNKPECPKPFVIGHIRLRVLRQGWIFPPGPMPIDSKYRTFASISWTAMQIWWIFSKGYVILSLPPVIS